MKVEDRIHAYIAAQPAPKQGDLQSLHDLITRLAPDARLWFLDGKDGSGNTVSNPNIGYGALAMQQAGGRSRDFYRVGLSANTTGISVYIMGLADKHWLRRSYGATLGKASITGYCIKFRRLADLDLGVLEQALRFGLALRA